MGGLFTGFPGSCSSPGCGGGRRSRRNSRGNGGTRGRRRRSPGGAGGRRSRRNGGGIRGARGSSTRSSEGRGGFRSRRNCGGNGGVGGSWIVVANLGYGCRSAVYGTIEPTTVGCTPGGRQVLLHPGQSTHKLKHLFMLLLLRGPGWPGVRLRLHQGRGLGTRAGRPRGTRFLVLCL
jgi:hypothetical protein